MQVHDLRQTPGYAARMLLGIDHLVIAVADPDHAASGSDLGEPIDGERRRPGTLPPGYRRHNNEHGRAR